VYVTVPERMTELGVVDVDGASIHGAET